MTKVKDKIEVAISNYLKELGIEGGNFKIEEPGNFSHGDYTSNFAIAKFSELKSKILNLKSPMDLANKIIELINSKYTIAEIEKIEVAGPGFINFFLSEKYLLDNLQQSLSVSGKGLIKNQSLKGKVVVEYSSPNIAKPFTIGHLRSTIIGEAIANLLEATGWEVYRDNHIGDWGSQFGKQIYAIKTWGSEEKIEKSENPVKELVNLYIKFHEEVEKDPKLEDYSREWFKKLEDGDSDARRLWQKCIDWSWVEFDRLYKELNVKFTENNGRGYGESFFEDKMKQIIEELKEKNLLKEDQGASLVYFENDKFSPLMILKQDGTTLYSTRDLATDKFRMEKYGKDVKIINEVGAEQSLYFQQLFELEEMLGWYSEGQRVHVRHGLYRFKDQKMSTRKGNVIWLEELLDEAEKRAFALRKTTQEFEDHYVVSKSIKHSKSAQKNMPGFGVQVNNSRMIGIGALKWNDLKRNSVQDIVFNWDDILNMHGDSGPYLQYTYARTQSVLAKVKSEKLKVKSEIQNLKIEIEEMVLLRQIARFENVAEEAANKLSPNVLCLYLFELSQKFNLFYQKHKIIGSENEEFRIALTCSTGNVLKTGLGFLGIESPKKM